MRRTIYVKEEDVPLFDKLAKKKQLSEVISEAVHQHFTPKEPFVIESRDSYGQPKFSVEGSDEWFIVIQTYKFGSRVERRGTPPNIEDLKEMKAWLRCLEVAEKVLDNDYKRIDSNP